MGAGVRTTISPAIAKASRPLCTAAVVVRLGIIEYSVATEDTGAAEAAAVVEFADLELKQASDAFAEVTYEANPYEGTSLEEFYTPAVIETPSIEDEALVAALDELEAA